MMALTNDELELAEVLLELASDHFANHSCNDFVLPKRWPIEQCNAFTQAMWRTAGQPDGYEPGKRCIQDCMAMQHLAARMKQERT